MRITEIKVSADSVTAASDVAGVQGSGRGAYLQFRFSEAWQGLSKRVIFTNGRGLNPVAVILGVNDLLPDDGGSLLNYGIYVPPEALEYSGNAVFIVEGTTAEGILYYTVRREMRVLPGMSQSLSDATESTDLTPSQAAHIQAQIDGIYIKSISAITREGDLVTVTYTNGETETFELKDGVSPMVEVTETEAGHSFTVTDVNGVHSFEVKDGTEGVYFKTGNALELTEDGYLNVVTASNVEADNTLPVTSAAVETVVGNIEVLLATI